MKKFIVETYYTCTFKTVHALNDLNEKELSKIESRTDGEVEVIDVKLNNRKTKKIGDNKSKTNKNIKESTISKSITTAIADNKKNQKIDNSVELKVKINLGLKCLIEEKVIFKKHK